MRSAPVVLLLSFIPLSAAQASLDDLRAGKVVGRVVLVP